MPAVRPGEAVSGPLPPGRPPPRLPRFVPLSDPATLSERQFLYSVLIIIAASVGLGATILARRLGASHWPDHRPRVVLVAAVALPMLAAFALLLPAPDPVLVPATLVWRFRVASLGSNLTLGAVLTLGVRWLSAEASRRTEANRDGADQQSTASLA